jgi:hypothetical protein
MSETPPSKPDHICFPLPDDVIQQIRPWNSTGSFEVGDGEGPENNDNDLLSGLSTKNAEGLSRIVPTMMCGEESAVHIFRKESKRVEDIRSMAVSGSLLWQIALEEAEHERLLSRMRNCLPISIDLAPLRRRARYFFVRVASRDPGIHFARIAGLDSGVCITLNCMLNSSAALAKTPNAYQIWSRIWRDEARHVRISRRHVLDLGLTQAQLVEEGKRVRKNYADILVLPLANDFENIGVDPDRLLRRIVGPEEV